LAKKNKLFHHRCLFHITTNFNNMFIHHMARIFLKEISRKGHNSTNGYSCLHIRELLRNQSVMLSGSSITMD